jgi:hypothetical protein
MPSRSKQCTSIDVAWSQILRIPMHYKTSLIATGKIRKIKLRKKLSLVENGSNIIGH